MITTKIDLLYRLRVPLASMKQPARLDRLEEDSIPKKYISLDGFRLTEVPKKRMKICFLGDIGGMGNKRVRIARSIRRKLSKADKIIANLNAPIVNDLSLSFQKNIIHPACFLDLCDQLPAKKMIFGLANNHTCDLGIEGINNSLYNIRRVGADYIGIKGRGKLQLTDKLILNASTACFEARDNITEKCKERVQDIDEGNIIHFLHWGNEYSAKPTAEQFQYIRKLSENHLLVAGHHSHCPQQIKMVENKLSAFSLGNFATGNESAHHRHGIMLEVEFVEYDRWYVETAQWNMLKIDNQNEINVHLC